MRISHIEIASAAAERLKKLLPSLGAIPGSVQAELFIIYSSLKYLAMELERMTAAGAAKAEAAGRLHESIEGLVQHGLPHAWADRFGSAFVRAFHAPTPSEPLGDRLVDVAEILELLQRNEVPASEQEEVMGRLSQYLFESNQADLNVFR